MARTPVARTLPTQGETHRFRIGQSVRVDSPQIQQKPGVCRVTARLPPVGTHLQYRIRNESEAFERVVSEHELSSTDA